MKYIDTSAMVKYYNLEKFEKGAASIVRLIDDARQSHEVLVSSFFLLPEAISTFDKWVRYKFITNKEFTGTIQRFLSDVKELSDKNSLILEPINSSTLTMAVELIVKHHMSVNDAIHLYAALTNKEMIDSFVCADEILLKAAKAEGFNVFNPETEKAHA